jgi:hypothetical protein
MPQVRVTAAEMVARQHRQALRAAQYRLPVAAAAVPIQARRAQAAQMPATAANQELTRLAERPIVAAAAAVVADINRQQMSAGPAVAEL